MTFGRIANFNWINCIESNGTNIIRTMTENRYVYFIIYLKYNLTGFFFPIVINVT